VVRREGKEDAVRIRLRVALPILLLAVCPLARAGSVNYGDLLGGFAGAVDFLQVTESTVTDAVPLYGAPTRVGNGLVFFPTAFSSQSAGKSADTTSGTLTVRIRADSGFFLEVINIKEIGEYELTGVGTTATSATINGLCTVTDISPGTHGFLFDNLHVTPAPVYSLPAHTADSFVSTAKIDLTGLHISEIMLNFNNNLQSTAEQGTTSMIDKQYVEIFVPEPATFGLLVGLTILCRRARRQRIVPSSDSR
jgi:hypothetical protein